jgi:aminopeptidase C
MKNRFLIIFFLTLITTHSGALDKRTPDSNTAAGYRFTPVIELKATPVKNQASTGTCWCFATTSFIESELLRMGKGEYDLSEMFIVRNNYIDKLKDNYLRQGEGNLGQGSLAHDWMIEFTEDGILPDEFYTGLNYNSPTHNHNEFNAFINAVSTVPLQRKNESAQYEKIVESVLDTYLGKVPETFNYKGQNYTPKTFATSLGISPEDYVEITSFTHFPFYSKGILEVPDNWRMEKFYNVPLDELIEIMNYSMKNGYTVNWDGDTSEKGFSHSNGVAIVPEIAKTDEYSTAEKDKYVNLSLQERSDVAYKFSGPFPEVKVTQEYRQSGYENFTTTDDHLMHITGITRDQNGKNYYITKNSWGTDRNIFSGYLNMSESYVRAKTIFIMVNKKGIPPAIKSKLGL